MNFKEFVQAYTDGSIVKDATWRAYDIEAMASPLRAREAMRIHNFKDTSSLGYAAFAAQYGISSGDRARFLLGLWRAWARIAFGEATRGLLLREGNENVN